MKQLIYILFPFSQKLCLYRWVVQVVGVSSDVGVSGVAWCLVACLWLWLVLVAVVVGLDVDRGYGLGFQLLGYTYA
jgi:hypothetical protein